MAQATYTRGMNREEDAGDSLLRLRISGEPRVIWDLLGNAARDLDVAVQPKEPRGQYGSTGTTWETIAVTASSVGGLHALGRIVVEVLRHRRSALQLEIGSSKFHFEGSQNNLERTLAELNQSLALKPPSDSDS